MFFVLFSVLELNFTETWGDPFYLGLTGIEIAGANGETIPLTMNMLDAEPRDLHVLSGYETDDRTLDKYVNKLVCLLFYAQLV